MTASSADWWHRQKIPLSAELSTSFSGYIPFVRPLSVAGFWRQSLFRFFDLPQQRLTDETRKNRFQADSKIFRQKRGVGLSVKNPMLFGELISTFLEFGATAHSFRKGFSEAGDPDFLRNHQHLKTAKQHGRASSEDKKATWHDF